MASKDPLLPVSPEIPSYSQIACIGTGLSAVALGATLQRWYGLDDIRFFDRHPVIGGTWYINSYPGCGCDVPSALYSYSFELNANWTKMLPSKQEIKQYHECVMDKYHLREKMVLSTEVTQCVWREDAARWLLYLRDVKTGREFTHECQILFAASGQLVKPRRCEIPGSEEFRGAIFHSARWDHSVSLDGKKVIVIGNGCTAAQIVPAIAGKVESLTQIIRSKHWVSPTHNFAYPPLLQWIFRYIPFAMRLHRLHIFLAAESDYFLFPMTKAAARLRAQRKTKLEKYMRATAPARYHDLLIPDFDVGCKVRINKKQIYTMADVHMLQRRIIDCGYLDSLHNDKITLTNVQVDKIVPEGIQTKQGDIIPADVIVLATGFETNTFAPYMNIVGRNRVSLSEHWAQYGGPSAYNCSVMSGFPNFILLLGPNAATGHTSALMAAENSINYALRILKPVLSGSASAVEIKQEAERSYVYWVQGALRRRVWNAGCVSWYLNESKWNSMSYPWTQAHFWWRSLFPTWSDWHIRWQKRNGLKNRSAPQILLFILLLALLGMTKRYLHLIPVDLIQELGA